MAPLDLFWQAVSLRDRLIDGANALPSPQRDRLVRLAIRCHGRVIRRHAGVFPR